MRTMQTVPVERTWLWWGQRSGNVAMVTRELWVFQGAGDNTERAPGRTPGTYGDQEGVSRLRCWGCHALVWQSHFSFTFSSVGMRYRVGNGLILHLMHVYGVAVFAAGYCVCVLYEHWLIYMMTCFDPACPAHRWWKWLTGRKETSDLPVCEMVSCFNRFTGPDTLRWLWQGTSFLPVGCLWRVWTPFSPASWEWQSGILVSSLS